ncbi:MAG: PH domain-containing protein [Culicoidibacterales bacterium]
MANIFGKMAADTLGISDIGTIIDQKNFDKVDGDDYIMHEDGERIFFVIKSKSDEYVFTNYGLLHVDGANAMSKKRTVKRYDFYDQRVSRVTLETAGTVDLDVEIKFVFGETVFSIDVDKRQLELLKDLYKTLIEISLLQGKNQVAIDDALLSLKMANEVLARNQFEGTAAQTIDQVTNYNFAWLQNARQTYHVKNYAAVYEKYLNN